MLFGHGVDPDLFAVGERRCFFCKPRPEFASELSKIRLDETLDGCGICNRNHEGGREEDEGLCGEGGDAFIDRPDDDVVDQVNRVRVGAESYCPRRIEVSEKLIVGESDGEIEDRHQGEPLNAVASRFPECRIAIEQSQEHCAGGGCQYGPLNQGH